MFLYDLNAIKQRADCVEVANWLGLHLKGNRCAATWRGGERDNSVEVFKEGFCDYGNDKKGGSALDLVMLVKGCDLTDAAELLGDHYNLPKTLEIKDERTLEGTYVYKDANGVPVHKTERWRIHDGSKDFKQYHYENGGWIYGLNGCRTYPYRVDEWRDCDEIHIHEGERKADLVVSWGINATSLVMGAGKWKPEWGEWFNGKNVVVVIDNDDAGNAHGKRVSWELKHVARTIKVLKVSDKDKGDIIDFANDGGTKEQYLKMVADANYITPESISEPKAHKHDISIEAAKKANKNVFCNYDLIEEMTDNGHTKCRHTPRQVKDMIDDLHVRLLGFPKMIGESIFDQDRETRKIHTLDSSNALYSWIAEKTGHAPQFKTGMGYISIDHLFSSLTRNSETFDIISDCPHYPKMKQCYYSHGDLPEPTEDHHYFHKFCSFFNPADFADALAIRVCVASLFYHEYAVDKPLFVVDTTEGQSRGVGKTKFSEAMAWLRGEESMIIGSSDTQNDMLLDKIVKRILSAEGRAKRVMILDNVEHYLDSEAVARLTTQASFSGLAPYGHGESTRENDLQYFITCNGGSFNKCIVDRSIIIYLRRPEKPLDEWVLELRKFIHTHRYQIYSDIISLLSRNVTFQDKIPSTRFKTWEKKIMWNVLSVDDYTHLIKVLEDRRTNADGEHERITSLLEVFDGKIRELGYDPDKECMWIESPVIKMWCREFDPNFGGRDNVNAPKLINRYIKTGQLKKMSNKMKSFPANARKYVVRRGLMWNQEVFEEKKPPHEYVNMFAMENGRIMVNRPRLLSN